MKTTELEGKNKTTFSVRVNGSQYSRGMNPGGFWWHTAQNLTAAEDGVLIQKIQEENYFQVWERLGLS